MKRVLAAEIGRVEVVDVEEPTPPPHHALVRTLASGICGSDTHAVAGHHPLLPPPYYPGHEAVGVVERQAADGTGPAAGTRVLLKPNVACGECVNCLAGRSNACQRLAWVGCDPSGAYPGAMAELFTAPSRNLYEVPADAADEQAVLVECLATPVHAARIAGDITGARVVVMGAGTIGILMLLAAREAGAGTIVVTDLDPAKRDRAVRLGADAAVDGAAEDFAEQVQGALGGLADVIFDCVAMEASARQWTQLVRRAATICIVGVPPRDFVVPMPLIQDWELRVQGCAAYTEVDVEKALTMAARIPADEIVTAQHPFEDAAAAFDEAARFSSGKVLVTPGGARR
ncbi:zinc-dependent alcohol dehydrogenase [Tessaracoccus oleiagri]|uniref:Threonine dehydrogenase n=1 Tax=Tessaracoccus oleiagri TaxID=686624 RepID=A0A1G9ID41_9ACTN|nr:alcohol dehydrogenase catalytic domain-containing protein [Tessaracoccus oleiagri]SDL23141.1 Threonine dehydrogenase [Tessaracoccus oleiagri]